MESLSLFDVDQRGRTRRGGARTSAQAAATITRRTEDEILAVFRRWDHDDCTWTADEMCRELSHRHGPTVATALSRLVKAGLVFDSTQRRLSDRGREQIAWKLSAPVGGRALQREYRSPYKQEKNQL